MFAARSVRPRRAVYVRGTVACEACSRPIHVYKLTAVAEEMSLRCPHCGARRFYANRTMTIEELPERRRRPRRD